MTAHLMHPDDVRAKVKACGTRFATVTFIKKDGSLRTINGLFRPASHIVGGEGGMAAGERLRANGLVAIYSLKDKGWRSFREDAVVEVKG